MSNNMKQTAAPAKVAVVEPKAETKAVAPVQEAALPVSAEAIEAASKQEVVASDVLIPRLLLMQGISPLVMGRKAQIGDLIRSTTSEKLGDPEHSVGLVPIRMVNAWIMYETAKSANQQQPAFRGMVERNASNEQLPWEYTGPEGQEMFRRKAIALYALVPSDVAQYEQELQRAVTAGEAPDLNRTVLPVVVTFQSTSFKYAGKKCASFFNNVRVNSMRVKGLVPFQYQLTLTCREEKKGTNSWYIFDLAPPTPLKDQAVKEEAARWATVLASTAVRVDEAGEVDESASTGSDAASEMEV
jgi:hypothetical protein